jgi:hypothetical protein
VVDFISAYIGRSKNFFRKIEICQKLPSFFAEKSPAGSVESKKVDIRGKGERKTLKRKI